MPAQCGQSRTEEHIKMSQKRWCLRLVLLVFIGVACYCSNAIFQSYVGTDKPPNDKAPCGSCITQDKGENLNFNYAGTGKPPDWSKAPCGGWVTWESLNFSMERQTDLFLKMDDFFWQKQLSALPLPYGVKGSEHLLLKVLAKMVYYQEPEDIKKLQCRTCVVIGNGFILKNSSLGSIIDNHDVVIRLNDAPVRGYEQDVGSKTTMRFFYPESATANPALDNEPGTLMVLVPFKPQDLRWLKEILYNENMVREGFWKPPPEIWLGDVSKIQVLDPHFLHATADRLLHIPTRPRMRVHPTTGLLAVFAALNYCDVVHIAGFGYPKSGSHREPIHYYGHDTMKTMVSNSNHDINREAEALKRLEDLGAILYLHPHS